MEEDYSENQITKIDSMMISYHRDKFRNILYELISGAFSLTGLCLIFYNELNNFENLDKIGAGMTVAGFLGAFHYNSRVHNRRKDFVYWIRDQLNRLRGELEKKVEE